MNDRPAKAGHIRWNDDGDTNGHTGTPGPFEFHVGPMYAGEKWLLYADLPGLEFRSKRGDDLGELKAEAERWLGEFVSSLGAVWPKTAELSESAAFQLSEARSVLARWDAGRDDPDGRIYDRERVLADQVKALIGVVDQVTADLAAREGETL